MRKIYLDNAATTQADLKVIKAMRPYLYEKFGNPNSLHEFGRDSREAIERVRKQVAKFVNCEPEEIIFTSGGTESDNLAIKGLASANPGKKHIITSKIEHPAVLETCREMEKQGYKLDYISVDKEGIINLEELKRKITNGTLLVSVMHVNNEIGIIEPLEEIAEICRNLGVSFHTDAVQSFGKLKIDIRKMNIDILSASGHKINCVKGIGILYVKKGIKLKPILNGGGQENKLRSGTENVSGIVALGKACEIAEKKLERKEHERIKKLRDKLIDEILKIPGTRLNGSRERRIFNNVNVSFDSVEGEALVLLLDKAGICASTGSACSSKSLKPSHVLKAIGLSDLEAHGSLRLTLGWQNDEQEIRYAIEKIKEAVDRLRKISSEIKI